MFVATTTVATVSGYQRPRLRQLEEYSVTNLTSYRAHNSPIPIADGASVDAVGYEATSIPSSLDAVGALETDVLLERFHLFSAVAAERLLRPPGVRPAPDALTNV